MQLAPPVATVHPVFHRYSSALMSLPGVTSIGWSKRAPDEVRLNVQTSELALLVDRVLADAVDGAGMTINRNDGGVDVPADSWVRNPTNVLRAMAALPGVVEFRRIFGYTLIADTHERAAWLRELVSSDIDGTPVRVLTEADLP